MSISRNTKIFLIAASVISVASMTYAADSVRLIVPIGGITETGAGAAGPDEYVKTFYQWSIGLAALLAMAQLVLGGFQYVLAAGNVSSKEAANERIRGSLVGLLILISIVTVLTTINPNLTNLTPASVQPNAIGALDYAALEAATQRDLTTLRSTSSTVAAVGARQRIQATATNGDPTFLRADEAMRQEIADFVARNCTLGICNDDLQEVVGDAGQDVDDSDMPLAKLRDLVSQRRITVDGDNYAHADFWQYANKAAEAYGEGDKATGDGYYDAVRSAVRFALSTMTTDDQKRMMLLISVVRPSDVKSIILGTYKK